MSLRRTHFPKFRPSSDLLDLGTNRGSPATPLVDSSRVPSRRPRPRPRTPTTPFDSTSARPRGPTSQGRSRSDLRRDAGAVICKRRFFPKSVTLSDLYGSTDLTPPHPRVVQSHLHSVLLGSSSPRRDSCHFCVSSIKVSFFSLGLFRLVPQFCDV